MGERGVSCIMKIETIPNRTGIHQYVTPQAPSWTFTLTITTTITTSTSPTSNFQGSSPSVFYISYHPGVSHETITLIPSTHRPSDHDDACSEEAVHRRRAQTALSRWPQLAICAGSHAPWRAHTRLIPIPECRSSTLLALLRQRPPDGELRPLIPSVPTAIMRLTPSPENSHHGSWRRA